jgi:aspartate kinase
MYKSQAVLNKEANMRILVQKFGGTSVADLECMKQVRHKVVAALERGLKLVVVLSARAGYTNQLLDMAQQWSHEPDPAEIDALVSVGEQVSATLFAMLLRDIGVKARSMLGWQTPIRTNNIFGNARIMSIDSKALLAALSEYSVIVMAGFQGVTFDNRITTLGRGGSDTSAVAVAAALGSVECEIYTDVDGVYTADPNMCSSARKIDRISYDEMLEMSSMGAKVLQIRSVEFAKKYKVPVHVRSTFSELPGTQVTQEDSAMEDVLVSGIAYDKDQVRVTMQGVADKPGISASIFGPLAKAEILVDMIVQKASKDGITDLTFTISRKDLKRTLPIVERLNGELNGSGVEYDDNVAKISVIGVGMRNHSGIAAKAFASLHSQNINILMISTSEIKISCLIEEKYTELAVRTLHDAFELNKPRTLFARKRTKRANG